MNLQIFQNVADPDPEWKKQILPKKMLVWKLLNSLPRTSLLNPWWKQQQFWLMME